jgi:hypothetical protein
VYAAERGAVLTRGNGWVSGVPGFGDNAFPALSGEYRLEGMETPEAGAKAGTTGFSVRTSRAPLFFSGDWEPRSGINAVYQRFRGKDFLAAAVLDGGPDLGAWTVIFEFPGGIEESGLGNAGFNRLIGVWSSKFLYFLSLIKTPGDVSLPAVVVF